MESGRVLSWPFDESSVVRYLLQVWPHNLGPVAVMWTLQWRPGLPVTKDMPIHLARPATGMTYAKPTGRRSPATCSVEGAFGRGLSVGRVLSLLWLCLTLTAAMSCRSSLPPVIFTSDRDGNLELYAVDLDSKSERNLTESSGDEFAPVVSPDGSLVAFLSGSGDNIALEVMKVNGTARQRLPTGSGKHRSQRWSPDNGRLAYIVERGPDTLIYVVDIGDTEPTLLTSISADEVGDWSPDGKWVVFAVSDGSAQGIYTRNPDGVDEFRLSDTPDFSPAWSPDSKRIAFLSERDDNPELYVMNADGTNQRRLTESDAAEYYISWSPDGKRLVFISDRDGNPEVYVTDFNGVSQDRLTTNAVPDGQPVWSPDGRRISFVSRAPSEASPDLAGDAEIFVMDSDGDNQTRLTSNRYEDTSPAW